MELKEIITQLCQIQSPSGFEAAAVQTARSILEPFVDEIKTDQRGNLLGIRRCGKAGAKSVLLDAHLDEIGLIVTGHAEGFLRFRSIGGVDPRMLPACDVTVLTDPPISGVITCLPPHVQTREEMEEAATMEQLLIDVGFFAEEQQVPIGTPVVYDARTVPLGVGQISGKSMDDRACFACLCKAAELTKDKELDIDLYILGSVQEEVGGKGAACAAFQIAPDCCVAVDVTHGRTPDASREQTFAIGGGAAIGVGPSVTGRLSRRMRDLAREMDLPHQLEVMEGSSGTNGWDMQVAGEGVPTMVLSLPLKYMHSPVETLALEDVESVSALLAAFLLTYEREEGPWRSC